MSSSYLSTQTNTTSYLLSSIHPQPPPTRRKKERRRRVSEEDDTRLSGGTYASSVRTFDPATSNQSILASAKVRRHPARRPPAAAAATAVHRLDARTPTPRAPSYTPSGLSVHAYRQPADSDSDSDSDSSASPSSPFQSTKTTSTKPSSSFEPSILSQHALHPPPLLAAEGRRRKPAHLPRVRKPGATSFYGPNPAALQPPSFDSNRPLRLHTGATSLSSASLSDATAQLTLSDHGRSGSGYNAYAAKQQALSTRPPQLDGNALDAGVHGMKRSWDGFKLEMKFGAHKVGKKVQRKVHNL